MRLPKLWIVVAACAALVFTAQFGMAQDTQPMQTLAVVGTGNASGSPDLAIVELGVELRNPDLGEAFTQVNQTVEAIIEALVEAGVDENNIQTSNLSVYQEGPSFAPMMETGTMESAYIVSNIVQVRILNIEQVSSVIETGLGAGANRVYGLRFALQDPTQLSIEAMQDAVADARTRAEALANELGVSLGDPVRVNWGTPGFPGQFQEGAIGLGGGADAVIREGQLSVTAQVEVVFEIGQ